MASPNKTGVADIFGHGSAGPSPAAGASTGISDLFGPAAPPTATRKATPPPPAHHGGGGPFGFLDSVPGVAAVEHAAGETAHYTAKTASGLATDAKNIPGGVYALGKAAIAPGTHPSWGKLGHEWADVITHPSELITGKGQEADPLATMVKGISKQTWQSLTDPAYMREHPDQTFLSLVAALSGVAKTGELGKATAAGYRGEDVARAAPRIVNVRPDGGADTGVHTVHFLPSTNPIVRHLVQGPLDALTQHGLDNPTGRVGGFAAGRVGRALDEQSQRQLHMKSVPAKRLAAAGSKLGGRARGAITGSRKVQQAALRLVAEQRTPEEALQTHQTALEQIAAHTHALAAAPDEATARIHETALSKLGKPSDHAAQAKLLEDVRDRGLVTQTPEGHVVIHPEHKLLQAVDARLARAGHLTETELARLDHQAAAASYLDRGGHLVTPTPDEVAAKAAQLAEGRAARIDAPNRIHAGGTWENPTPGKSGLPLPAEIRQTARVASLQKLHDAQTARAQAAGEASLGEHDAMIGGRVVGPGAPQRSRAASATVGARTVTRTVEVPRTAKEAAARLAEIEAEHNAAVDRLRLAQFGKISPQAEAGRTKTNRAIDEANTGLTKTGKLRGTNNPLMRKAKKPSILEEHRGMVEKQIDAAVSKDPTLPERVPQIAAWLARREEIDKLRTALEGTDEPSWMRDEPATPIERDLGTKAVEKTTTVPGSKGTIPGPGRVITPAGGVKAEGTGAELSAAKTKLERMQEARARRTKAVGIVGGAGARPGRQYVPYYKSEQTASSATVSRSPSAIVGKAAEAVPSHEFTGGSIERGLVPDNTTGLVARHLARIVKQAATIDFRRDVPGSLTRKSARDVLVNTQELRNATVPDELKTALGGRKATLDELAGEHAAMEELRQRIVPILSPGHASDGLPHDAPLGTPAPHGFKWVDQKALGALGRPAIPLPGRAARGIDAANAAQTAATVYYKIGHVATRGGTNAFTNLIQGSLNVASMTKAFRVWQALTEDERDQALAGVGGGGFSALPQEGLGKVGRVARAGSAFWAHRFDAPSRFLALHYEATRSGFGSAEKFRALLREAKDPSNLQPHERATVDGVFARADRAAIRYDGLNDFEKRYLQRAIWFYPWLKGATKFAGHAIVEHPTKMTALGIAGANAAQQAEQDLGPQPSYNAGYFKVGGGSAFPTVVNANTVSPFATPGEVADTVLHANHPTEAEQLSNYLSPVFGALARAAFHLDTRGRASTGSVIHDAAKGAIASTPEEALLKALTATPDNQSRKMFPTTPAEGLLRFLGGSIVPRKMNTGVANRSARAEAAAAGKR